MKGKNHLTAVVETMLFTYYISEIIKLNIQTIYMPLGKDLIIFFFVAAVRVVIYGNLPVMSGKQCF